MASDITLAFAHPEERSRATADLPVPDRISLRDHVVSVEIGAFQPERGTTQRLSFNVVVEVRPAVEVDDDVDRILSYDRITEAIQLELARERLNLLETLAERVAGRILAEPQALRVFVRIEKLDLGPGALGVEIVRDRVTHPLAPVDEAWAAPLVVHLSPEAVISPNLTRWLDDLEGAGRPAILTVGLPDLPRPHADHVLADRRIGLLAIEQEAWVLSGRDPRCVVVDSRTELDWARSKGRISVWAPSKMVLDAAEPPDGFTPEDLTQWLARQFGAERTLFVGGTAPDGAETRDPAAQHLLISE